MPSTLWPVWSPLWKRRNRWGGWLVRFTIAAVMLVLNAAGYEAVLRIAEWRDVSLWDSTCWVDRAIPATPWSLLVYATLYLYFAATILLAPRGDRGCAALCLHMQAQVFLGLGTFVVFLTLPTHIGVRAEMEALLPEMAGPLRAAYERLYEVDVPYNAWPSLHVSLSLLMLLTSARFTLGRHQRHPYWPAGRGDGLVLALWWPAWVALCWSVVATKQHFFLDVWTGALAALCVWFLYLRRRLDRAVDGELQKT